MAFAPAGVLGRAMDSGTFSEAVELQRAGRHAEALAIYQALAGQALTVNLAQNLGVCLLMLGRADEAAHWLELAARHRADDAALLRLLGTARLAQDRLAEAEALFRRAVELAPDDPHARLALGEHLLSLGRYAEGWPHFEARVAAHPGPVRTPHGPIPEWRGEPLAGRTVALVHEQGLGDQLQFVRFAARLKALGARVLVTCHPALARLFETAAGVDQVAPVAAGEAVALPPHDAWIRYLSAPHRLGVTLDDVWSGPYLSAPPRPDLGGRIGVMVHGNLANPNRARALDDRSAQALLALPGALNLAPEHTGAADFRDTAEIVAGLDLVVTVDTSVAHLAGALGKPVWILLHRPADWRWLAGERLDSPWYPTARLFRQPAPGDWASVVADVRRALGA